MADFFDEVTPRQAEGLERLGWRRVPRDRADGYGDWQRPDGSSCTEDEAAAFWRSHQKEVGE